VQEFGIVLDVLERRRPKVVREIARVVVASLAQ
jgi:hypothetical protein